MGNYCIREGVVEVWGLWGCGILIMVGNAGACSVYVGGGKGGEESEGSYWMVGLLGLLGLLGML